MSKPNKRRFKLVNVRSAEADRRGGDTIEIEAEDGTVFEIPAPGFWPDAVKETMRADDLATARILIGDRYDEFVASGGRADDVLLVIKAWAADQGADLGESSPSPS